MELTEKHLRNAQQCQSLKIKGYDSKNGLILPIMPKEWHRIAVPGYWEDQGVKDLNGVVWYRREIDVPASMTNVPAKVFLGRIVDADELYINGVKVGTTGYHVSAKKISCS